MNRNAPSAAPEGALGCSVLRPGGLPRRGQVAAVFERSAHVLAEDGAYLTLGRPELPAHPYSLLWDGYAGDFTAGAPGELTAAGLCCDGRRLAGLSGLPVFTPRESAPLAEAGLRGAALEATREAAAALPPRGGFHALLALGTSHQGSGHQADRPNGHLVGQLNSMEQMLGARLGRSLAASDWTGLDQAALELAGLGQGLTPAGDDFLAGALAALRFFGKSRGRPVLPHLFGRGLAAHAGARTTPFSAFLLGCAATGGVARPLSDWLDAAHRGQAAQAAALVPEVADLGHSSGLDALCGMVLALQNIPGEDA